MASGAQVSGADDPAPGASSVDPSLGSGGPRSEGTRRAILDVARAAFAAHGYEKATIRAIAAGARIDPSMVMRYFGSKAGLFSAASTMHLEVPDLVAVPAADRGERLVRQFVDRWEDPVRRGALVILLRTAATDDAVRAQLQDVIGELVLDPVATVAVDHAARRGALIGSQLLGVALCRYVYGIEPMASLPVDEVIAAVAPVVQRYLTEPSVEDVARR